ncbi:MAG: outer membrane beta-barrel protein [Verrucomicrobiaceae bacterium]|nr:outer membrane beta-barrel protein [Verrucomicrobiaceae bacterium]
MKYDLRILVALAITWNGLPASAPAGETPDHAFPSYGAKSPIDPKNPGDHDILATASPYRVDLFSGLTYLYNSNTTQLANGTGASVGIFDFGFDIGSRDQQSPGGFWNFDYNGQVFMYEDALSRAGRDSLEQRLGTRLGINGAKTSIVFDASYHANNGNDVNFEKFDREARRAQSDDYDFDIRLVRELPRGSFELGAGHSFRDFRQATFLNDGSRTYGDAAWYYEPGFAPKTQLGLGVEAGVDDFDRNFRQDYVTPSFRWRYRLSGKTSFYGSVGSQFREIDAPGGIDSEALVYRGGMEWAATGKTSLNLEFYRDVSPSYVLAGESFENTGLRLKSTHQLPGRFVLGTHAGYERADYFATMTGVASGRQDDYYRLGVDLSHPMRLTDKLDGECTLFYNYNENQSNLNFVEFDQHLVGIRFGLLY